jgi:hypothetical protein
MSFKGGVESYGDRSGIWRCGSIILVRLPFPVWLPRTGIDIQVTVESLDPAVEGALSHIGYQQIENLTDHPPIGFETHAKDWIKWVFKPPAGQLPTNLHVRIAG